MRQIDWRPIRGAIRGQAGHRIRSFCGSAAADLAVSRNLRAARTEIRDSQHHRAVFRANFDPIALRRAGIGLRSPYFARCFPMHPVCPVCVPSLPSAHLPSAHYKLGRSGRAMFKLGRSGDLRPDLSLQMTISAQFAERTVRCAQFGAWHETDTRCMEPRNTKSARRFGQFRTCG